MKCPPGKKSIPIDKQLYNRTKNTVKRRSRVWPSAYASGQLVRAYKSKGGRYRCSKFGSLDRWFKEKWVDVCRRGKNGKYKTCGRKSSSWKNYPYCRPLHRVNNKTPRTVRELGNSKIKAMCRKKRKNPRKRIFQFGENKNPSKVYEMNKEPQTCGFGKRGCGKATCKNCFGIRRGPGDTWNQGAKREALLSLHNDRFVIDNFYVEKYLKLYIDKYVNKTIHIKGTPTSKLYHVVGVDIIDGDLENPTFIYMADSKGTLKNIKAKNVTDFVGLELPKGKYLSGPEFGRKRSRFGNNLGPTSSNLDSFYKNGTANSLNLKPENCLSSYLPVTRFGKEKFIQQAVATMKRKGTTGSFTRWCKRHGFPKVTTGCINLGKRDKSLKIRRKAVFAQNIRSKSRKSSFGNVYRNLTTEQLETELKYAEERYQQLLKPENPPFIAEDYKTNTLNVILQAIKEKGLKQYRKRESLKPTKILKLKQKLTIKTYPENNKCNVMFGKRNELNSLQKTNQDIKYLLN
jgi:hypothetical protein